MRPTWTFLTNHGHVLLAVATDPDARVKDIAKKVGITPRSTLQILKDLEASGYLHRSRDGRRTRYAIEPHQHFRHPATATREIDGLIGLFADPPSTAAEPPRDIRSSRPHDRPRKRYPAT
ncbi:helix-turn-helix transcriptional regulator [Arthrobacter sp. MW3 TE3886]|uniref:helix-turn-helix transcriptional regulator n=1 Tax=Arthrobacter sp. MW3 TE3886 TaxID=3156254 RepID=UPI0035130C3B